MPDTYHFKLAKNDGRYLDEYGFGMQWQNKTGEFPCFECGTPSNGRHHVVPRSLGGTKQLPLCSECHNKVHGKSLLHPELIKEALQKARLRGVRLGAPLKVTEDVKAQILKLRKQGTSFKAIAEKVNLSVGTIHKVTSDAN